MFRNIPKPYLLLDMALVATVAIAGGVFASQMFDALGDDVLEWRFSVVLTAFPSPVMFAAGRGMNNINVDGIPELAAFYRGEVSSFDPALIPEDYEGFPLGGSYAYMHFYLLYAIGWAWRIFGISFHSIHLLCIFLYMVMIAALYGVFRLGMGRLLSFVGVMIAAASPAYLLSCPSLRDFGKAPFMLLCFLLLGIFLKQRHSRRSLLVYGVLYGLVAGIGYGFRQDLLICIPAGIIIVAFFTQVEAFRPRLTRLAASLLLLFAFLVVGFPVMYGVHLDKGSASAQAFTQGVSEIMEDRMDFGYASYTMHHHYSDYFDFTVVNNYARRTGYEEPMEAHFSPGHGEAGGRFMRDVMRRFPADMFARGLASLVALSGVNATATQETSRLTQGHGGILRDRAALYGPFSEHFDTWGLAYALAALVVLSVSNIRLGIAVAFLGVYFGAYPSLLYEFRHFFHLAFVPYWAAGYLISKTCRAAYSVCRKLCQKDVDALRQRFLMRKFAIGFGFVVMFIAALGVTLVMLRIVQQQRVDSLLRQYANISLVSVDAVWSQMDNAILLRPVSTLPGLEKTASLPVFESAGEYLALSLKNTGYPMRLQILYEDGPMTNFSQWCAPQPGLTGKSGNYLFVFPVYELVWPSGEDLVRGKFIGITVPEQYKHAVKGLYRVKNSEDFPLWPFIALPEHKHAFLTSKTGPFERAIAAGWVEMHSLFGWRPRTVLAGYRQLLRHYPGYKPFENRALEHIRNCADPELALELCSQLLREFPHLYASTAADVDMLLGRVRDRQETARQLALQEPWSLTQRGLQLEEEGRHDEAAVLYRQVLKEAPTFLFAAENLDKYLRQYRTAEERLQEWTLLRQHYPRSSLITLFYGMALRGAGQMGDAEACFSELSENDLGFREEAQLQIAATKIMSGQQEAGITALTKTLDSHPEKKKEAAALCSEAGRYFMEKQDYDNAIMLFGMACDYDPDDLWPCVMQGESFAAAGKVAQAKQVYKQVLLKAPESPYTAFNLDSLFDASETAERLAWWRELHEAHPEAAVPLMYLGKAHEAAGGRDAALEAYQKALAIDHSLDDAKNGVVRLEAATVAEGE